MYYVSSVEGNKIGVTDTNDWKEDFLSDQMLFNIIKKGYDVYGTSVYNNKTNSKPIQINQGITIGKLKTLLKKWKEVHNQWNGHPVEDYLASAKIGTMIVVKYQVEVGKGWTETGTTVLKKLSYDSWHYEDTDNINSGIDGNHRFAAWALEVACIYSNPVTISVK